MKIYQPADFESDPPLSMATSDQIALELQRRGEVGAFVLSGDGVSSGSDGAWRLRAWGSVWGAIGLLRLASVAIEGIVPAGVDRIQEEPPDDDEDENNEPENGVKP